MTEYHYLLWNADGMGILGVFYNGKVARQVYEAHTGNGLPCVLTKLRDGVEGPGEIIAGEWI